MLAALPRDPSDLLVVGMEHPDDGAVVRSPGGDLLVQTVDLIAPIVNDPADFGRVAAANSLSDVYAMGGRPFTALNVMCFPASQLPMTVLREILEGGLAAAREAGCLIVGGHTVVDPELKYGLSVTGLMDGGEVWSIDRARIGDVLLLTKPIGTGIVNQALRKGRLDESSASYGHSLASMSALNAAGARAGRAAQASAVTDVTGFGLLGHAAQFARASRATFEVDLDAVPMLEGVRALIADGVVPKRSRENADAYRERVTGIERDEDAIALFDPQTSGGLLACVAPDRVTAFREALADWPLGCSVIGRVAPPCGHDVVVR